MMRILRLPFLILGLAVQSIVLALGQIWANKVRSVLTTTGIVIGISSVMAVVAGLTGLQALVVDEVEMFGASRIFVWPTRPETGPDKRVSLWRLRFYPEQVEGMTDYCPSVDAYMRQTATNANVNYGSRLIEDAIIMGIDTAWHKIEKRSVTLGRPFSLIDVQVGNQVCLIPPDVRDKLLLDRDCIGEKILIDNKAYTIVGIVEPPLKMAFVNTGGRNVPEVFVPFTAIYNRYTWMDVQALAKSPEVADEAKAEITFFLRNRRHIKPVDPNNFNVETVQRALEQFKSLALGVTAVAGSIVAISLLVGGIGIMNIMLVSVTERTREIGLRKAVGATSAEIMFQFLVEAVTLCLVGGLVGLAIGELLTLAMAGIPHFPLAKAHIPLWAIGLSLGFASLVGLFFGIFPAIKAARLDPIEALRHE